MESLRKQLTESMPPVFAGRSLDQLTGNAVRWRTIQNKRANKEVPEECFLRHGSRKVLVVREPFLDWWLGQLV
ncbi:hypothetical protein [uncultured Pseudodesulfovibrio sp.]|uniref:hypothetical protein n=1 Tax=uncultured Pseudodesulfovibrio sp. TaxID=2035858 RepID=UPI0029C8CA58|nr:hypothetical protein [uncultured Pseudodesulfovibrio sp.]